MARAICMAATFMVATAVVQANHCSSGGECPSDDEPQNRVSLLQTNLRMNVLKDGPSIMKIPSAMPTELEAMVRSGETPALDLVEAGSDSIRLSTCFPKEVDVYYDGCLNDASEECALGCSFGRGESLCNANDACKQFKFEDLHDSKFFTSLHLGYDPDSRTLCIAGNHGYARALSTVQMIKDAVRKLDKDCKSLSLFGHKTIWIGDMSDCNSDMAYSAQTWRKGCKTKLIPDFALYNWAEAGLLPDYKGLIPLLALRGSFPAAERRCGWAGNVRTNPIRMEFARKFSNSTLFDIVAPESDEGKGGVRGRISMAEQVERWACFVELPGAGYSGRMPYLLNSGRPILIVERGPGIWDPISPMAPMAATWYSRLLVPWVHYLPVLHNMSDLEEKAKFALGITPGSNATKIAAAAKELAQTHLSYDAAIKYLADSLL